MVCTDDDDFVNPGGGGRFFHLGCKYEKPGTSGKVDIHFEDDSRLE